MNATYSPEDNKLRLYSLERLDSETYQRVKGAGFKWAPKQGLFVAPMWTPARADLLLELCGEIGDEDTSLMERAAERSERFAEYQENRVNDSEQARAAVSAITKHIPFGQPILVGHHSERRARRDMEKIENGMRKSVRMWECSEYWKSRAAGAICHAKYKELPAVRARRIKTIEADLRKKQRQVAEYNASIISWANVLRIVGEHRPEEALKLALHYSGNGLSVGYSLHSDLNKGTMSAEDAACRALLTCEQGIAWAERWINHFENRLSYERAMLEEAGGIETDKTRPEKGGAVRCWVRAGWVEIQKVNKVSVTVLDNWGNGGRDFTRTIPFDQLKAVISKAEFDALKSGHSVTENRPAGT